MAASVFLPAAGRPTPAEPGTPPPPRCIVATGPRGAGKTRWLQQCIRRLREQQPARRCAVLLAEEGRTRMEGLSRGTLGVTGRKLFLPCLCCPALVDLPAAVRALAETTRVDWLFLELPVIAAASLLAEFDRILRWPRSLAICPDTAWTQRQREHTLWPFQSCLLESAITVVATSAEGAAAIERFAAVVTSAHAQSESPPLLPSSNPSDLVCSLV